MSFLNEYDKISYDREAKHFLSCFIRDDEIIRKEEQLKQLLYSLHDRIAYREIYLESKIKELETIISLNKIKYHA